MLSTEIVAVGSSFAVCAPDVAVFREAVPEDAVLLPALSVLLALNGVPAEVELELALVVVEELPDEQAAIITTAAVAVPSIALRLTTLFRRMLNLSVGVTKV